MTKAYMSDAGGRTIGAASQWSRRNAIREAQRVLAEAEAGYTGRQDTPCDHPTLRWLASHGPVVNDTIVDGRHVYGDAETHQSRFREALAESLAAVLPVLDTLAEDAASRAYDDTVRGTSFDLTSDDDDVIGRQAWAHIDIFDRNRATLAAMDVRQ